MASHITNACGTPRGQPVKRRAFQEGVEPSHGARSSPVALRRGVWGGGEGGAVQGSNPPCVSDTWPAAVCPVSWILKFTSTCVAIAVVVAVLTRFADLLVSESLLPSPTVGGRTHHSCAQHALRPLRTLKIPCPSFDNGRPNSR